MGLIWPALEFQYGIAFEDDVNGVKCQAVLFDYVEDSIDIELDIDDKDRAVCWLQQKRATVDMASTKS
jgi:hypothetical protein